ncbi:unnamed protein product [Vitrella brassicaformis CCMP3155]|uniref:Uncharacterized protein n=1 Tax=Vitrella brassicaformis (strain CCMP3155) TaxID=1169540 RepID=A0A0G4FJX2_VITBC|nr:unnamed protein product [Vitrella brassicaformis CCMP3155]|eukprot:CEM14067.1 unnamed protein product [Vitrella brassicaformis CCMP3155]
MGPETIAATSRPQKKAEKVAKNPVMAGPLKVAWVNGDLVTSLVAGVSGVAHAAAGVSAAVQKFRTPQPPQTQDTGVQVPPR